MKARNCSPWRGKPNRVSNYEDLVEDQPSLNSTFGAGR